MLWSLFALSKEVVTHLPIYDDGCVRIEVTGGSKGVATMFDKDLLIYICSYNIDAEEDVHETV